MRRLTALAVNLASVSQQLISVGLLIGGFYMFNAGNMSMGAIIAIVMLAGRALAPIGQFAFLITRARQAMTTLDSLQKMMEAGDERQSAARSIVPEIRTGTIELEPCQFPLSERGEGFARRSQPDDQAGRTHRRDRPGGVGQVDARPRAVRPVCAGRGDDDDRRPRQPPISPAPDPRQLPLRRPGRRAVQRHGARQSDARRGAGRRRPTGRRRGALGRRHFPVARRRRVRPAGGRARIAAVGRAARLAGAGARAWSARASCSTSTSRRARWTPRPNSISSII